MRNLGILEIVSAILALSFPILGFLSHNFIFGVVAALVLIFGWVLAVCVKEGY